MDSVWAATWASSTEVAEEAMVGKLWCSANQIRSNPSRSASWASYTLWATASDTA